MAVYFVTGKLGCGKTLCTVGKIKDYLSQGRRVATNLDINLTAITGTESKETIIRVPDKPVLRDLEAIGRGCEVENEDRYGLLVLDELGTWFNSRNWRDKERLDVIDWFLHARKLHWDIFFIVQNIDSLDGQLVNALCEHLVVCKRTDRLTIPYIGAFFKLFGVNKILPKIHVAKVYYGQTESGLQVGKWWYRGRDLYHAYNTAQIFDDASDAVHSLLPAYYLNNIALINHHQKIIESLRPVLKNALPTGGGFLNKASIFAVALVVLMLCGRSYAKYQEFKGEPNQVAVIQPAQVPIVNTPPPVVIPAIVQPVQDDFIKSLTQGKMLHLTSYYEHDGNIDAVLHTSSNVDQIASTFTLDDARSLGYVVILHGDVIEVRKGGYYFTFHK